MSHCIRHSKNVAGSLCGIGRKGMARTVKLQGLR